MWVSFLLGFEQGTTVRVGVFYIQNRCYPAAMAGKLIEFVLFVIRFESHAYLNILTFEFNWLLTLRLAVCIHVIHQVVI